MKASRYIDIPIVERVKIQAQVLIPLVKTLQAELGEERANAIVRRALGDLYRKLGEKWWRVRGSNNLGDGVASAFDEYAAGDALDYEVLKQTPDAFEINVNRCRYAEFYKELGTPELGFLLTCSADFLMAEGFGPDVKLTRTQTIMQGASHCDFRYALEKKTERVLNGPLPSNMASVGSSAQFKHRLAKRDDLRAIVEIYNSTVPSRLVTADTEPVSVESRVPWFEAHVPETRPLWVAEADGRIAGWLSFSSFYGRPAYNKTAELSVYVQESFRRHGLGSYFLRQALAHAPSVGVDTLLGFIFGHNTPSLALFARSGFVRWGELPKVAALGGIERDLVIVGRRV